MEVILETGEDKQSQITKLNEFEAWCTSEKCTAKEGYLYGMAIKNNAGPQATFCEDCGHALLWMKKDSKSSNGKFVKIHQ